MNNLPQPIVPARSGEPLPTGSVRLGPKRASRFRQALGRLVLAVCRHGSTECANDHCRFWTICQCARQERAAAWARESTVWLIVALCSGLVLLYWLIG